MNEIVNPINQVVPRNNTNNVQRNCYFNETYEHISKRNIHRSFGSFSLLMVTEERIKRPSRKLTVVIEWTRAGSRKE